MSPDTQIEKITRLNNFQKEGLKKLGLNTVKDLLFYLPTRYEKPGDIKLLSELTENQTATVFVKVKSVKTKKGWKSKVPMAEAVVKDDTGTMKVVWFNQAYMAKKISADIFVELQGTVSKDKNGHLYMTNPLVRETSELQIATTESLFSQNNLSMKPIYPETKGVSSLWISQMIKKILQNNGHLQIKEPIPEEILKKYNLPPLKDALIFIHSPRKEKDALVAQKRFAFEEIFFIQLHRQKSKKEYQQNPAFLIGDGQNKIKEFVASLGFALTIAQRNAIDQILKDLENDKPMTRLLEGDVGSGKTAVAGAIAYATVTTRPNGRDFGHLEVAYMAPTEILAKQHFQSFIKYFEKLPINIGLITGKTCYKFPSKTDPTKPTKISKNQLLKLVANGEIPFVVGTHALIADKVKFRNLALVIIDEQHRFGIKQRLKLADKKSTESHLIVPHLLSMTATPIPRTLALTIYGDLDLSVIDQMPSGRKPIKTKVVLPAQRKDVYEHIKQELGLGRQAYIICPRIDEPDPQKEKALNARSAVAEAKRLELEIFQNQTIGVVHGKLKPKEKDAVMNLFLNGEIDILVATSVIEVGVNVPNATTIVIEGAERFGLAQLHQLRGRVLRSNNQAYCYLFTESRSQKTFDRLRALITAKNGFELAELDLMLRGPGELGGKKQWGLTDLAMEAIKNIKMVEVARIEAGNILENDPQLKNHPQLLSEIVKREGSKIHME